MVLIYVQLSFALNGHTESILESQRLGRRFRHHVPPSSLQCGTFFVRYHFLSKYNNIISAQKDDTHAKSLEIFRLVEVSVSQ